MVLKLEMEKGERCRKIVRMSEAAKPERISPSHENKFGEFWKWRGEFKLEELSGEVRYLLKEGKISVHSVMSIWAGSPFGAVEAIKMSDKDEVEIETKFSCAVFDIIEILENLQREDLYGFWNEGKKDAALNNLLPLANATSQLSRKLQRITITLQDYSLALQNTLNSFQNQFFATSEESPLTKSKIKNNKSGNCYKFRCAFRNVWYSISSGSGAGKKPTLEVIAHPKKEINEGHEDFRQGQAGQGQGQGQGQSSLLTPPQCIQIQHLHVRPEIHTPEKNKSDTMRFNNVCNCHHCHCAGHGGEQYAFQKRPRIVPPPFTLEQLNPHCGCHHHNPHHQHQQHQQQQPQQYQYQEQWENQRSRSKGQDQGQQIQINDDSQRKREVQNQNDADNNSINNTHKNHVKSTSTSQVKVNTDVNEVSTDENSKDAEEVMEVEDFKDADQNRNVMDVEMWKDALLSPAAQSNSDPKITNDTENDSEANAISEITPPDLTTVLPNEDHHLNEIVQIIEIPPTEPSPVKIYNSDDLKLAPVLLKETKKAGPASRDIILVIEADSDEDNEADEDAAVDVDGIRVSSKLCQKPSKIPALIVPDLDLEPFELETPSDHLMETSDFLDTELNPGDRLGDDNSDLKNESETGPGGNTIDGFEEDLDDPDIDDMMMDLDLDQNAEVVTDLDVNHNEEHVEVDLSYEDDDIDADIDWDVDIDDADVDIIDVDVDVDVAMTRENEHSLTQENKEGNSNLNLDETESEDGRLNPGMELETVCFKQHFDPQIFLKTTENHENDQMNSDIENMIKGTEDLEIRQLKSPLDITQHALAVASTVAIASACVSSVTQHQVEPENDKYSTPPTFSKSDEFVPQINHHENENQTQNKSEVRVHDPNLSPNDPIIGSSNPKPNSGAEEPISTKQDGGNDTEMDATEKENKCENLNLTYVDLLAENRKKDRDGFGDKRSARSRNSWKRVLDEDFDEMTSKEVVVVRSAVSDFAESEFGVMDMEDLDWLNKIKEMGQTGHICADEIELAEKLKRQSIFMNCIKYRADEIAKDVRNILETVREAERKWVEPTLRKNGATTTGTIVNNSAKGHPGHEGVELDEETLANLELSQLVYCIQTYCAQLVSSAQTGTGTGTGAATGAGAGVGPGMGPGKGSGNGKTGRRNRKLKQLHPVPDQKKQMELTDAEKAGILEHLVNLSAEAAACHKSFKRFSKMVATDRKFLKELCLSFPQSKMPDFKKYQEQWANNKRAECHCECECPCQYQCHGQECQDDGQCQDHGQCEYQGQGQCQGKDQGQGQGPCQDDEDDQSHCCQCHCQTDCQNQNYENNYSSPQKQNQNNNPASCKNPNSTNCNNVVIPDINFEEIFS